jgi:hypothetical protein
MKVSLLFNDYKNRNFEDTTELASKCKVIPATGRGGP